MAALKCSPLGERCTRGAASSGADTPSFSSMLLVEVSVKVMQTIR